MQGATIYADLRRPSPRPDFTGVACLRDLDREQMAWMARQDAFAGRITFDGAFFEWHRMLNLHPKSRDADRGRFWYDGAVMVEQGRDIPYIEHWHRMTPPGTPAAAAILSELTTNRLGVVVRLGNLFMLARQRPLALPDYANLAELVARAPSFETAQDHLDCEVSFGSIGSRGWTIERSSLPYREGVCIEPELRSIPGGHGIAYRDQGPAGEALSRHWIITELEGDLSCLIGAESLAHA